MRFRLEFECDNGELADPDARQWAISALVQAVAEKVMRGDTMGTVYDVNGNSIGWFSVPDHDVHDFNECRDCGRELLACPCSEEA